MTLKSTMKQVAGFAIAAGLALGTVVPAQAQTLEELQALIATLQAQIAALTGGTSQTGASCNYVFTQNLTVGSTGAEVMNLQKVLNMDPLTQVATGASAGAPGYETSYFGPATRAAVIKFQNQHSAEILAPVGLNAGTGYVGPSTRAKLNMMCTTSGTPATPGTPGTPTTPGTGTEGYMVVTLNSSPSNEQLDEGETDDVASIDVEAFNSDMTVNRVDANFNKRPWLYFDEISLMANGDEIWSDSSLSSGDFIEQTEGSDYRLRMTGFSEVVEEGDETEFVLRVTVKNTLDTTKAGHTVTVTFNSNSVRATDTKGLSHEEPNANLTGRNVTFQALVAGDVDVTINTNSPDERFVRVSKSGETSGVELLRFDIEAEQQDININGLTFNMGTMTGPQAAALFADVYLADESGNKLESASTIATATLFTTLDDDYFDINKGDTKTFRLMVDVIDADATPGSNGAVASTTLDVSLIDAEDGEFNTISATGSDITGSDVHFNEVVANASSLSATATGLGNNDYLTNVEFKFTLTADGGNVYVDKTVSTFVSTSTTASSASLTSVSASGSTSSDTSTYYTITSGASRTFTFSGSMDNLNGTAGTKKFEITAINWGDTTGSLAEFAIDFDLENLEVNQTLTAS